jgi:hypothetical protein
MRHTSAHQADLFMAELLGEAFDPPAEYAESREGPALRVEAGENLPFEAVEPDTSLGGAVRWSGDGPEPFFGDRRDQHWKVVAKPGGAQFQDLRADDLVVRRGKDGRTWRCTLGEDVEPETIYRRGRDRFLRRDVVILRRVQKSRWIPQRLADVQSTPEVVEVCGFFGPNNVRRSVQEIRAAVVARANSEWTAWHTAAGAPRKETEVAMVGRLVGYYLAAVSRIPPDTLTAMQTAAVGTINYSPLASATTTTAIATEAGKIRATLLTGAPGATATGLEATVDAAIVKAREAHLNTGAFRAWSAAFVSACVRGAAIAQGLEAVIAPGRRQIGADELLQASLMHAAYTVEARRRREQTSPRRRGTYHAFTPAERAPALGDIIVQDRRSGIAASQVVKLKSLVPDQITHGDIVVDVQPGFVVGIGGNLGDSSRRRRFPVDAAGKLVIDRRQLYTQEDDAGTLATLPLESTAALAGQSTARVFAVLSLVEECAAVPGQPYGQGVLT